MKPSALARRLTEEQRTQLVNDAQSFVEQFRAEMESSFWPKRREYERQANDDFSSRGRTSPQAPESIFDLSNESLNIVRNVTRFMKARCGEDVYGTKPTVAITPVGTMDAPLAEQLNRHGPWKLEQAQESKIGKEGIGLSLDLGEHVRKTTHRTDRDPHESLQLVLCDIRTGKPVIAPLSDETGQPRLNADGEQEGDYIYPEDPTFLLADPTSGEERHVYEKYPELFADETTEFREVLIEEDTVTYHGLDIANVRFDSFIASLTVAELSQSPAVCHEYPRTVSQLRALYYVDGDEEIEELFRQLEQEPDTPKTAEDRPRDTYGEVAAGGTRMAKNPPVKVQEIILQGYDPFGDGRGRNIFMVLVADHDIPLYVEYLANITIRGQLCYHAVPVNRVPGRWYGRGFYELYEKSQRLIDALINCINVRNQNNADPITFFQPTAVEDGVSMRNLVRRPNKVQILRPGMTAKDAMEIIEIPDLDERTWQLIQLIMQLIQTDSGVTSAAQGDYSALPSANTATGISSILQSASTLHRMLTEDLKDGLQPAVKFGLMTAYAHQDTDETFQYLEGQATEIMSLASARNLAALDLNVRILLTRFKMREERESALSLITDVVPQWATMLQLSGLPTTNIAASTQALFIQIAKGSDIHNADQIFALPQLVVQPAAGEPAPEEEAAAEEPSAEEAAAAATAPPTNVIPDATPAPV